MPQGPRAPNDRRAIFDLSPWAFPILFTLSAALVAFGCASAPRHEGPIAQAAPVDARALPMFDGDTGEPRTWSDLRAAIADADVILVGETHDHAAAHAVEAAIVEETLTRHPPSAVAMEMLERDHQDDVDAYLAGTIDLETFIERTGARRWEFDYVVGGDWERFYQPMIETAKATGSTVVAANAPRKYVRLARTDGFPALLRVPPEEQALFDVPVELDTGEYRRRFDATMSRLEEIPDEPLAENDAVFRAQQTWDATMATSIVRALNAGASKVVLAVGAFHVQWRGGVHGQLRHLAPNARILVVTVVPATSDRLAEAHRGSADLVLYGGPGPSRSDRDR